MHYKRYMGQPSWVFLYNKMPWMLQLQEQFHNKRKGASSIHKYCYILKHLADTLHDVDAEISWMELVTNIIT